MSRRISATFALVAAAVLFFAVNMIGDAVLQGWRLDLTENKLYTLSDGSKEILGNIEEPVTLRFFFSKEAAEDYPGLRSYAGRVEDLLKEIEAKAEGGIDLRIIDPEPFSEEEDLAVRYGLTGVPTDNGDMLYFGLVGTNTLDDQEMIPYFSPERQRFIEYDIIKLIDQLTIGARPVIGLYSALPLQLGAGGMQAAMQGRSEPYMIYEQLQEFGRVRTLASDMTTIDEDVDVLVLIHPGGLSDSALYAIDQFILSGGRALILADPYSETAALPSPGGMPASPVVTSDLDRLFSAWGIEMADEAFVADTDLAQRVRIPDDSGRMQETDYLVWLEMTAEQMSGDDPVTAELSVLSLGSAGSLNIAEEPPAAIEPLLTSTVNSGLLPTALLQGVPDPEGLRDAYQPDERRHILAARISGMVPSAFPDGPPPVQSANDDASPPPDAGEEDAAPPPEPEMPHRSQSDGPINVILVADSDLVIEDFWAQVQSIPGLGRIVLPIADNANFVLNAVDQLSGSGALISLRSRGISNRPFTLIEQIRREAETQYRAEEERLSQKLQETERRIRALQSEGPQSDGLFLSPEQEAEIESFRAEAVETREALREVQRNLRRDIEALERRLRFINIALVPFAVILFAIGFGYWRRHRRRLERAA